MIVGILLMFLVIIIYIDFAVKDFILNKRKNNNRIIRTLENIYLEISSRKKF